MTEPLDHVAKTARIEALQEAATVVRQVVAEAEDAPIIAELLKAEQRIVKLMLASWPKEGSSMLTREQIEEMRVPGVAWCSEETFDALCDTALALLDELERRPASACWRAAL